MKLRINDMMNRISLVTILKTSSLRIKILTGSIIIILVYVTCLGLAPHNKFNAISNSVLADTTFLASDTEMHNYKEVTPLLREKAYKEALIDLSGKDSIQLIVNLHDSFIYLTIKGVMIHSIEVHSYKIDPFLKKMPNMEYLWLFSHPHQIMKQKATIVKEPIVVRNAPKDTIEAALNAFQPDTLIQKPAFLQLRTAQDIDLIFEQDSNPGLYNKLRWLTFRSGLSFRNGIKSLGSFFTFKKLENIPKIWIKVPVDDLRTIYRALPDQTFVVIYYDAI